MHRLSSIAQHDLAQPARDERLHRARAMILQAGRPDNDVLLYWPIFDLFDQSVGGNKPNINFTVHNPFVDNTPFGKAADWLAKSGYSFDYISDAQLQSRNRTRSVSRDRRAAVPEDADSDFGETDGAGSGWPDGDL